MTSPSSGITPVALPRIDLVRAHAEHFCFICTIEDAGLFLDLLASDTGSLDDEDADDGAEDFGSFVKYRRSSTTHMIAESVSRATDDESVVVRVAYDIESEDEPFPPGRVPKDLQNEGAVLARLSRIGSPVSCFGHAIFAYAELEAGPGVSTAIELPIRSSQEDAGCDEITGVRGVKFSTLEKDKLAYSFSLDRWRNRNLSLTVNFVHKCTISSKTPEEILELASDIARRLVQVDAKGTPK